MKYKVGDYLRLTSGSIVGPITDVVHGKTYPYRTDKEYYESNEIVCAVEVKDIKEPKAWNELEDWNGDYAPSVPESFEAWAKGKKIKAKGLLGIYTFVRLSGNCYFESDGGLEMSIDLDGLRWVEYKEPEHKEPELKPYDNEHLPSCFTFRRKDNRDIMHLNYNESTNDFWYMLGYGKREFSTKNLLDHFENLDGTPCGWRE